MENRNHYKRAPALWREDDHRHRRAGIAQNRALTRNALLATIPFSAHAPLPEWLEPHQRHPDKVIQLITHAKPVP